MPPVVGDAPDAPVPEMSTVADAEAMVLSCLFRVDVTRPGRAYPRGVECWCHDRITSNQPQRRNRMSGSDRRAPRPMSEFLQEILEEFPTDTHPGTAAWLTGLEANYRVAEAAGEPLGVDTLVRSLIGIVCYLEDRNEAG